MMEEFLARKVINTANNVKKLRVELLNTSTSIISAKELFYDDYFIIERDGICYELDEKYCINKNCDCTEVRYTIIVEEKLVGEILYDYKKGECREFEYASLLDEFKGLDGFNLILELRHEVMKKSFEALVLETEIAHLHRETRKIRKENEELDKINTLINSSSPNPKTGRNEICYCGSGKKYKNCCIGK